MKNVLWFSRHTMTDAQFIDLKRIFGEIKINQVSITIQKINEISNEIEVSDILAIVAPIGLQEQFVKVSNGRPVISARTKRILVPSTDGGEDKADFVFDGWFKIKKIEVVTEDL